MGILRTFAALVALGTLPSIAAAQPAGVGGGGPRTTLTGLAAVMPDTDLEAGGTLSYSRWYVQPGVSLGLGPRRSVGLSLGLGQTAYSLDASGLSDDFDVTEVALSVPLRFPVGERGVAFVVPRLQFSAESGVDISDGTTWGAIGAVAWRVNPTLTIGPGLGVFSSLEGDLDVFPILVIDWAITDRLSLSTGRGLAASRGPGLNLSYAASDAWSFGLSARYESVEFRLDDSRDGVAADGIAVDRSVPVVLSARWTPSDRVSLTGFAGAATAGNLEFQDKDGRRVADSDYDTAPIFGLVAEVSF